MCWQIKPWLPSWSPVLLSAGWGRVGGLGVCGARIWLSPDSPSWTPPSPPQLDMAACLAYRWVGPVPHYSWGIEEDQDGEMGICAILILKSPHSHLPCPSLFLTHTLHSLPVPPLWIEEQQIELGRRRLMSSGFATQHLLWHTKLEQQAPLQYAHKLVSYNTEIKKETGLATSNWDFFTNNGNNLKIGQMCIVDTSYWPEMQMWSSSMNSTTWQLCPTTGFMQLCQLLWLLILIMFCPG